MNGSTLVDLGTRNFSAPNSKCRHLEYKSVSVKWFESLVLHVFDADELVATDTVKRSERKPVSMQILQDWPLSSPRVDGTVLVGVRMVDSKKVPVLFGENVPLIVRVKNARIFG